MSEKTKLQALLTLDRERLAELYYQEGRLDKAASLWAGLGHYQKAGRIALSLGDGKQATRWFLRAALGSNARRHEQASPAEAASLLVSAGYVQEAMALYELAGDASRAADCAVRLELWQRAARSYEKAHDLYGAGLNYERAGKLDEAGRVLARESERLARARHRKMDTELAHRHREVDLRRVKLYRQMGHADAAARLLRQWKPNSLAEAEVLEEAGLHDEAVAAYLELGCPEAALRLLERQPDPDMRLKAEVYAKSGRLVDAVHLWTTLGEHRRAAEALEGSENWELAAQRWELLGEPLRAARAYERGALGSEAARCFVAADQPLEAARLYGQFGEHDRAAVIYASARRAFDAATCLLAAGREQEAIELLKQVEVRDRSYLPATLLLLPFLIRNGEHRDALRRIRRVPGSTRQSDGATPEWIYWEARALEAADRTDEAKQLYRQLLTRRGAHRDAAQRYEKLRGPDDTLAVPRRASSGDAATTPSIPAPVSESAPAPNGKLPPGYQLAGRYEILSELGRGGMGQVYKAYDRELKETVAIKSLRAGQRDPADEERLLREVQICRRITHPNIVRVHDLARFEGGIFITMEFIEGLPLTELLAIKQRLERARSLLAQLLSGLKKAHSLNVIHRDLKPGNIMVSFDRIKILDFGIARIQGFDAMVTQTGDALGSPLYMSPEQLRGLEIDCRSDLYSLGVVLYTLLAGREPFLGDSVAEVALAHLHHPPPDLREFRPDLPGEWVDFVGLLLAKSPADRFRSAAEAEAMLGVLPV